MEKFPVAFASLADKVNSAAFTAWASSAHPEEKILTDLWENDSSISNEVRAMHHLIMVKTFRQDRLVAAAKKFTTAILGATFDSVAEKELDLVSFSERVSTQKIIHSRVLFCLIPLQSLLTSEMSNFKLHSKASCDTWLSCYVIMG
jgi:hypothetical protein